MKILIVAKTKMKKGRVCVGGIDTETNQLIRLMNQGGNSIPSSTNLQIGEIWEVDCTQRKDLTAPHIEDVIIGSRKLLSKGNSIANYVDKNELKVWKGGIKKLFDGKLGWTGNGNGYIGPNKISNNSVGFWRTDKVLTYDSETNKYIYKVFLGLKKGISYKGHKNPIAVIPKGTLVRVSLARWWHPPKVKMEDRCYLQLSGWY